IDAAALVLEFFDHAQAYGAQYIYAEVAFIKSHSLFDKEVHLKDGKVLKAKTILIADGMVNRVPSIIKNIDSFLNRGVSFCTICDGPLYGKNPTIVHGS
ncbi:thioredoxin reductase, partial [Mycoplasmopsis synoviae]